MCQLRRVDASDIGMKQPRRVQPRTPDGRYGYLPAKPPTAAPTIPQRVAIGEQWACPKCGTQDRSLQYPSGKIKYCTDCQRFMTLAGNARKPRANGQIPGVTFDREQFLAWIRAQERVCSFCKLPESQIGRLGLKTSVGYTVQTLGVDRQDNNRGYEMGNIQLCCFACNKAKGNVFTNDEFETFLGSAVSRAWSERLPDATPVTPTALPPVGYATCAYPPGTCNRCGYVGSGADKACKACRKFDAVSSNAAKPRRDGNSPGVTMTREEFAAWLGEQSPVCRYCGTHENVIPALGLKTQQGLDLKYLGIDRIDNDRGYEADNIALCCYACNKVKGNVFSDEEMRFHVGPQIARIWQFRLFGVRP